MSFDKSLFNIAWRVSNVIQIQLAFLSSESLSDIHSRRDGCMRNAQTCQSQHSTFSVSSKVVYQNPSTSTKSFTR